VTPLMIVDGANVVGSVPDGWWRDRAGANERLRDGLGRIVEQGLPEAAVAHGAPEWAVRGGFELVLVVEGVARSVGPIPGVQVLAAPGSGDDAVVELVAAEAPRRPCLVVTADRALRDRVAALGADVIGPRWVRQPDTRA